MFCVFAKQGSMSHDLREPILGAPVISLEVPMQQAPTRLVYAMTAFNSFGGELHPNFEQLVVNECSRAKSLLTEAGLGDLVSTSLLRALLVRAVRSPPNLKINQMLDDFFKLAERSSQISGVTTVC